MTITCVPINGNPNINLGVDCELIGTGTFGSLELVNDGQGGTFFVDKAWTGGETIIATLLFFLIVLIITRWVFDFFLPPRIRIKKQT